MDGGRLNWNWRVFIERWRSEVDELVVYVAAFCFGGALSEPTINPGVDCSEDSLYEGGIVSTLGFVGGEIGGNLWLPRFEAYGEQRVLSKK